MNKRRENEKRSTDWGGLFLIPGFIGFMLFFVGPFGISLVYSFLNKPTRGVFVGFANYAELFHNASYQMGLKNTLIFMGLSVPLSIAFSLLLALMIEKTGRYKDLFALIFLIPLVIPSGSMVFFWKALFAADGYLNGVLSHLGIAGINWLNSGITRYVIVFIYIWKNLGYNIVLFRSGLNSIPKLYYEAAALDGASSVSAFVHITIGNLIPTFIIVIIMSIINSFKVFREIYLLTGNYPHESIYMLQHFMNNMFSSLNYPKLTSATNILILLIALLSQALLQSGRRKAR